MVPSDVVRQVEHGTDRYGLEIRMTQLLGRLELATSVALLPGVTHRSKFSKLGYVDGTAESLRMWAEVATLARHDLRSIGRFIMGLTPARLDP